MRPDQALPAGPDRSQERLVLLIASGVFKLSWITWWVLFSEIHARDLPVKYPGGSSVGLCTLCVECVHTVQAKFASILLLYVPAVAHPLPACKTM
jgi:hypothetical protein